MTSSSRGGSRSSSVTSQSVPVPRRTAASVFIGGLLLSRVRGGSARTIAHERAREPRRAPSGSGASGHRRDDRDLVPLGQRGIQAPAETNVFVVEEEVHELPRLAVFVQEAALEAREAGIQLVDRVAQVDGGDLDGGRASTQVAERARDAELGHGAYSLVRSEPSLGTT